MKLVEIVYTVFTNMPSMDNSTKTVKRLLNVFENHEVQFNSIQLLNIVNNVPNVINRPQVVNQKDNWRVEFLPERINFIVSINKDEVVSTSIVTDKTLTAKDCIKKLFEEFHFKGSRFALNTTYVIEDLTTFKMDDFLIDNHINGKDKLFEWNTRKSYRESVRLGDVCETLNIIEEVNRVNKNQFIIGGKPIKLDGLVVHFDINTTQLSKGERFKEDQLANFMEFACNIEQKNASNFEEVLK